MTSEVELLLFNHLHLWLWLHLLTEFWDDVVVIIDMVSGLEISVLGQTLVDTKVDVMVLLWLVVHQMVSILGLMDLLLFGLEGFHLGVWILRGFSIVEGLLLLGDEVEVVLGVVLVASLDSHTVVELGLVDGVMVLLWSVIGEEVLAPVDGLVVLIVDELGELGIIIVVVLGVDVVVTELNGHTIVELGLVNGIVVLLWDIVGEEVLTPVDSFVVLIVNELSEFGIVVIVVVGVNVVVTGLDSHTVVELSLVDGVVMLLWDIISKEVLAPVHSLVVLVINELVELVIIIVVVLGMDVVVASLEGHTVVHLIEVNRWVRVVVLGILLLLSHDSFEFGLSGAHSIVPVWGVSVLGLHGHSVVHLVEVNRWVSVVVKGVLLLLPHESLQLSLGGVDSIIPIWRVSVLGLNVHAVVELLHIDGLVVSGLLSPFSLLCGLELLLDEGVSGAISLCLLLFGLILLLHGLLELGSLLVNLLVPELGVGLVPELGIGLESDLVWLDMVVKLIEVNSLNSGLLSLLLSEFLSLLPLLSLSLGLVLDGLSLGLLGSLLGGDLLLLLVLHLLLELLSPLVDEAVPLLGVLMVVGDVLHVIDDVLSVVSMWNVSISELHVHGVVSGLLVHDGLNLIRLLLELVLGLLLDELVLVKIWLTVLVFGEVHGVRELHVGLVPFGLLGALLLGALLEEGIPLLVLGKSLPGGTSQLLDWGLLLTRDVVGIVLVVELHIGIIVDVLNGSQLVVIEEVILILVVVELHILASVWVMVLVMVVLHLGQSLFLSIISLVILEEEPVVVASWGELGIGEGLMVVADSWEVLWGVSDVWVVWAPVVFDLSTMKSLSWIVKIKPVGTLLSLLVEWGLVVPLLLH